MKGKYMRYQCFKKGLFFFFLTFSGLTSAQDYGHEWIDFSKEYFKIQDAREGIFKVTYQELAEVGFPVDVNPLSYQLFRKGKELAIRVIGEDDGVFNTEDYILYYGKKLDGSGDASLYQKPDDLTNPYINLFSDTSSYFLTHSSSNPKRIQLNRPENSVTRDYLEKSSLHTFLENYSMGDEPVTSVFRSEFDVGEGWMQSS